MFMESYTNFGPQKGDGGVAIFEKMHEYKTL